MMDTKKSTSSDWVLHVFISRQPKEKQSRLYRFFPEKERKRLMQLPPWVPSKEEIIDEDNLLSRVHWSWFLPTLRSYSPQEQPFFLSALDPSAAHSLSEEIPCKKTHVETTSLGKAYFKQLLMSSLVGPHNELLPTTLLPDSPLSPLLTLSKSNLVGLIDLLAMHDLAVEIRQIVETKILKKIYSTLSESQQKFLKTLTSRHEVMAPIKMGLERWDLEEESLRHLLHRRGLIRLGLALSNQNPSFKWFVCHLLDIGRGGTLFKLCEKAKKGASVDEAVRQVVELLGDKI